MCLRSELGEIKTRGFGLLFAVMIFGIKWVVRLLEVTVISSLRSAVINHRCPVWVGAGLSSFQLIIACRKSSAVC